MLSPPSTLTLLIEASIRGMRTRSWAQMHDGIGSGESSRSILPRDSYVRLTGRMRRCKRRPPFVVEAYNASLRRHCAGVGWSIAEDNNTTPAGPTKLGTRLHLRHMLAVLPLVGTIPRHRNSTFMSSCELHSSARAHHWWMKIIHILNFPTPRFQQSTRKKIKTWFLI